MKILMLPFKLVWSLVSFIFQLTGRLIGVVLGAVFLIVGFILSVTVIGAIIGIPLIILGLLLVIKSLF